MVMFASIDHHDVPWRASQKIELWPSRYNGEPASMVTRPNFQHNPPNPILVAFREAVDHWGQSEATRRYLATIAAIDAGRLGSGQNTSDPEARAHARRVLQRLANLTNDKED